MNALEQADQHEQPGRDRLAENEVRIKRMETEKAVSALRDWVRGGVGVHMPFTRQSFRLVLDEVDRLQQAEAERDELATEVQRLQVDGTAYQTGYDRADEAARVALEGMRAERDAAIGQETKLLADLCTMQGAYNEAAFRARRAEAALAPFARVYWQRHSGQDDRPIMTVWDQQQNEFVLTAGDFHRAADALAATQPADGEGER